jgi:hypothetical protein
MGKTSLSASNGISRQHNNYRQSYTTQMERVTIRSKARPLSSNGESIEPDSAILSIIRGTGSDSHPQQSSHRQLQGNRNRRRSLNQQQLLSGWNDIPCSPNYRPANDTNRRRRTHSGGAQQQISVVDQMAAQPHIPYAILPKRFEPKQVAGNVFQQQSRSSNNYGNLNGNNRHRNQRRPVAPRRSQRQQDYYNDQWIDEEDDDLWLEPLPPTMHRRVNRNYGPTAGYYGPRVIIKNNNNKNCAFVSSSNVWTIIMMHIHMVHQIDKDKFHFVHVVVYYIKMMVMLHLTLCHPMISMNGKDHMHDHDNHYILNNNAVEFGKTNSFVFIFE